MESCDSRTHRITAFGGLDQSRSRIRNRLAVNGSSLNDRTPDSEFRIATERIELLRIIAKEHSSHCGPAQKHGQKRVGMFDLPREVTERSLRRHDRDAKSQPDYALFISLQMIRLT
jgi:hypothetical protein